MNLLYLAFCHDLFKKMEFFGARRLTYGQIMNVLACCAFEVVMTT